jgi:hypothetical protein
MGMLGWNDWLLMGMWFQKYSKIYCGNCHITLKTTGLEVGELYDIWITYH